MTKNQLRRLLLRVPNVVHFCQRHDLSLRTVMRLRTRYEGEPTKRTMQRMVAALTEEGIIESGERQPTQRAASMPGRKRGQVAGRVAKKLG
jgi:hypothetical protein